MSGMPLTRPLGSGVKSRDGEEVKVWLLALAFTSISYKEDEC